MVLKVAAQTPAWPPGTRQGYHGISLGWYEGELIRRVDPQKRSLGRFFADEIAAPRGIEFYIGLPADVSDDRRAVFHAYKPPEMLLHLNEFPAKFGFRLYDDPREIALRDAVYRSLGATPQI